MKSEVDSDIADASGCRELIRIGGDHRLQRYRGIDRTSESVVRLIVFSAEVSANPRFREAFKADRDRLVHLNHAAVARYAFSGECNGQLYFGQTVPNHETLNASDRIPELFADDIVEVGWQLCSALQHAHNFGLSHQGVSGDSILLSEDLRAMLVDFRVEAWLATVEPAAADPDPADGFAATGRSIAFKDAARRDLVAMLEVLLSCARRVSQRLETSLADANPPGITDRQRLDKLESLLKSLVGLPDAEWTATARDVQGMLGELLIGESRDSMPIVDDRADGTHMRRSIVDELFDDDDEPPSPSETVRSVPPPERNRYLLILPIVLGLVCLACLLWAAGVF